MTPVESAECGVEGGECNRSIPSTTGQAAGVSRFFDVEGTIRGQQSGQGPIGRRSVVQPASLHDMPACTIDRVADRHARSVGAACSASGDEAQNGDKQGCPDD